jgi:hypothetical protein
MNKLIKKTASIAAEKAAEQDAAYYERQDFHDSCWQDVCQFGELINSILAQRGQKPHALVKRALARVPAEAHWLVEVRAQAMWPLTFGGRRASETV